MAAGYQLLVTLGRIGPAGSISAGVDFESFQRLMAETYGERDTARGRAATIAWLTEEVGELAQAVRKGDRAGQAHELGDVLAWLASLANQLGISLDEAVSRYTDGPGCPACGGCPCTCPT
jgi:NTP pyrophosphatase (non-canonical NTP hydrolase)